MGWTFTPNGVPVDFHRNGIKTPVHANGNNVAWKCEKCGHPVLFVYLRGRIGSSQIRPTECPACHATYYLEPQYVQFPGPPNAPSLPPANPMQIM